MHFIIVEVGSKEWEHIWKWLENHPLNEGLENKASAPNEGEEWEYMGSYLNSDGKCLHSVRHRFHPTSKRKEDLTLHASDEFSEEQIKVKKKL